MPAKSVYNLYQSMERENAILSYNGHLTAELIYSILDLIEMKLNNSVRTTLTKKKVFGVMVECLQNLYHHNKGKDVSLAEIQSAKHTKVCTIHPSTIIISQPESSYFEIKTGNFMVTNKVDRLKEKIDYINSLSSNQLKRFYQKSLKDGQISDKGTAGLGLIDIARKSKNKLQYSFIQIDNNHSYFCLNVKIN